MPPSRSSPFALWLNATMQRRGLTQADLARAVGVADTQVSRWRRGQVVPTIHYLQRMADTLGVPRPTLDELAGYPVFQALEGAFATRRAESSDPVRAAELHAHQAQLGRLMEERVPRDLWPAFVEACGALAEGLDRSYRSALRTMQDAEAAHERRNMGFSRGSSSTPPLPADPPRR